MDVCSPCAWRPEEGIGSSGTAVADGRELWVLGTEPGGLE